MEGVSIDLGTANTVVWDNETGERFNEPTMMALSFDGGRYSDVVGIGAAAEELVGRAPDGVEVIRPLRDGVITDLETTRRFLREILQGIAPTWWQRRRLSAWRPPSSEARSSVPRLVASRQRAPARRRSQ